MTIASAQETHGEAVEEVEVVEVEVVEVEEEVEEEEAEEEEAEEEEWMWSPSSVNCLRSSVVETGREGHVMSTLRHLMQSWTCLMFGVCFRQAMMMGVNAVVSSASDRRRMVAA